MHKNLNDKISILKEKLLDDDFLRNRGLSNEIGYYIFDYNPQDEILLREEIKNIIKDSKIKSKIKVKEFNLLDVVLKYLDDFQYRNAIYDLEEKKGLNYLIEQFDNILNMDENRNEIVNYIEDKTYEEGQKEKIVIFITGIGEIFPIIRAHNLLNTMHQIINYCPVIFFFPGKYDGLHLKTLGKIEDNNYYRAFPIE